MLNQDFCEFLEYEITKALSNSEAVLLMGFWCDGVLLPYSESEYSKNAVNDKRQIVMTAFVGQTGQDKYELILRFGRKALIRYERDLSLEECVPKAEDYNWLDVDPEKKKMVVQLD